MTEFTFPTTGSLVWRLALKWRTAVDRVVEPFGLTHAQYSVLASLYGLSQRGGVPTQRELASYTGLRPIYISKLVRALEMDGQITRLADPIDARAMRLTLTDQGFSTIRQAMPVVRDLDRKLTSVLGGPESSETQVFNQSLRTLLMTPENPGD